ncbi:MAG: ABC transporter substrate-binding protein [Hyperthermus sp.]|nr:MAG: ABC transporter substrate-binding protein [Hyperthermus sp.]
MASWAEVILIVLFSLRVSLSATLLSAAWSLPLAFLAARGLRAARVLVGVCEGLVGVPTVLVGLVLYMLLSRHGPLGGLGVLYTPTAIVIGESILVTPIITAVGYRVLKRSIDRFGELALSLGASEARAFLFSLQESLPGLLSVLLMGFSRAIGELGVALMVGGNIRGYTRTMTTAIALEVSKGEFGEAIVLGIMLVAIMLASSLIIYVLGREEA